MEIDKSSAIDKSLALRSRYVGEALSSLLSRQTPPEYIKTRQGPGGTILKYVDGAYITDQLNSLFGFLWDFDILDEFVDDAEVIVLGCLTAKVNIDGEWIEIRKTQYGSQERLPEVPLGFTKKAAATDALKKCASLLGIALDVYSSQPEVPQPPSKEELREKSERRLYELGLESGMSREQVDSFVQGLFNKPVSQLSVRELAMAKRQIQRGGAVRKQQNSPSG